MRIVTATFNKLRGERNGTIMNKCDCASELMRTPLSDCSMLRMSADTDKTVLARIYVPAQVPGELFSMCEALQNGTVYPELYQPYDACNMCCSPGCDGEAIHQDTVVVTPAGSVDAVRGTVFSDTSANNCRCGCNTERRD